MTEFMIAGPGAGAAGGIAWTATQGNSGAAIGYMVGLGIVLVYGIGRWCWRRVRRLGVKHD